jgi:hypothetical protein
VNNPGRRVGRAKAAAAFLVVQKEDFHALMMSQRRRESEARLPRPALLMPLALFVSP